MKDWIRNVSDEFTAIHLGRESYVCRKEIFAFVTNCVNLLYPSRCEELRQNTAEWSHIIEALDSSIQNILQQMHIGDAEQHSRDFIQQLPSIKKMLDGDGQYFASEDPACESVAEVILCYPGFLALTIHRLAHQLYLQKIPLLPRIVAEYAHERTGIDIHPGASLQSPIFIDHGTGIVIGETCKIGHHVKIFQGVTLGAPSVKRELKGRQRHPTVGNHVILYANATILGGETHIGDHSTIGGNVWLISDVPPNSEIYYKATQLEKVKKE